MRGFEVTVAVYDSVLGPNMVRSRKAVLIDDGTPWAGLEAQIRLMVRELRRDAGEDPQHPQPEIRPWPNGLGWDEI